MLLPNMVLTNEPGCYFIDFLIDSALANPSQSVFFDQTVLARFRRFGGVRLEDVICITEAGVENFTLCPRTVQEVQSVMAGGVWPPVADLSPQLCRKWGQLNEKKDDFDDIKL